MGEVLAKSHKAKFMGAVLCLCLTLKGTALAGTEPEVKALGAVLMEAESGRRPAFTAAQISRQSPVELAKAYYREKQGTEMDADLTGLLEQVCRELEQEKEG